MEIAWDLDDPLVGSEMCIRDRPVSIRLPHSSVHYVAAVIKEDKEFIEKLGYVPSLAEIEGAMYLELSLIHI